MSENEMTIRAREQAEAFIRDQTQFQLGFLETEKAHPRTRGLDRACELDLPKGIRILQEVDRDILPTARRVFASEEFGHLQTALQASLQGNGRIIISGCGATGRLAILLEKAWRTACGHIPAAAPAADRLRSFTTGGDYALIRSVESFEDYESFGRRQAEDLDPGEADTFVAVSEGGETSSVIGSALLAAEKGARVFFVFNNPADILSEKIERSRAAIQHPGITPISLCTGPMAVAGSTRMQATTIELLVLGHALESVFQKVFRPDTPADSDPTERFARLLENLEREEAVAGIAGWVELESKVYVEKGCVTYFADQFLLDLLTDTTERAPTFMLPPFLKSGDASGQPSWAFVKNPGLSTEEAWPSLLGRLPRCLEWQPEDYRKLGASPKIVEQPPAIGEQELMRFRIGKEDDPVRHTHPDSTAIAVLGPADLPGLHDFKHHFDQATEKFPRKITLQFGPEAAADSSTLLVPCEIPASDLRLWEHLAAKLIFNIVSTATMARLGRIESNWMGWVEATNKKLIDRSIRLVSELCGISYTNAATELFLSLEEIASPSREGQPKPSPTRHTINRWRAGNPGSP